MVDSRGLNVEWERPKRAKRPNKPNKPNRHSYITHCSLHLMSQALRMECPSVGVRTMSAARDSKEEGSVPRVSSDVFVVTGSEVGHLSGLRIERTKKRFFVESLAESGFCCNFANEFRRVVD